MILAAIVGCELAFWVVLLAGLAARYLLRRPRLGAALLILTPVIDAVLLVLVTIDLLGGGTASWPHGLAAIYLGVSVAYGKRMVAWGDVHFHHRFAGGPAPTKLTGARYTAKCWRDVLLTGIAVILAAAILGSLILIVDDAERTAALSGYFRILGIIFAIDLIWATGFTLWPKNSATSSPLTSSS